MAEAAAKLPVKEREKAPTHAQARPFDFQLPNGVDADKIEANFKNGVLTVTLPKKSEAQKPEKKIDVKAA